MSERTMRGAFLSIVVSYVLFSSSFAYAVAPWHDYDPSAQVSFAAIDAPTGGEGGRTVEVRTLDELRAACERSEPLTIHIINDLDGNPE